MIITLIIRIIKQKHSTKTRSTFLMPIIFKSLESLKQSFLQVNKMVGKNSDQIQKWT